MGKINAKNQFNIYSNPHCYMKIMFDKFSLVLKTFCTIHYTAKTLDLLSSIYISKNLRLWFFYNNPAR